MATWTVRQATAQDGPRIVEMFNMVRAAGYFRTEYVPEWTLSYLPGWANNKVVAVCEVSDLQSLPGTHIIAFAAIADPAVVQRTNPTTFNLGDQAVLAWDTRLPTADHVRRACAMCMKRLAQYCKNQGVQRLLFSEPVQNALQKCTRPDWMGTVRRTLIGQSLDGIDQVYEVEYDMDTVELTGTTIEAEPDPDTV